MQNRRLIYGFRAVQSTILYRSIKIKQSVQSSKQTILIFF